MQRIEQVQDITKDVLADLCLLENKDEKKKKKFVTTCFLLLLTVWDMHRLAVATLISIPFFGGTFAGLLYYLPEFQ